jgi:hypothetical protein
VAVPRSQPPHQLRSTDCSDVGAMSWPTR